MLAVILFVSSRYLLFTSAVKFHKRAFREAVLKQEHNNSQQLFFSAENLYRDMKGIEWKENNKEVVIKGRYHEVLAVVRNADGYVVHIIEDRMENELFLNFFERNNSAKKVAETMLFAFAFNFTLPPANHFLLPANDTIEFSEMKTNPICQGFCFKAVKPPQLF